MLAFYMLIVLTFVNGIKYNVNLGSCSTLNCITADSTDAYKALQYALKFVNANGGGDVVLQQGTYIVSVNLEIYNSTRLIGQGIDKTTIKLKDYAAGFFRNGASKSGLIRATVQNKKGCDNIAVMNLTLDGNKVNQYTDSIHKYGRFGIFTEACMNVIFNRVKVVNMQGYGFDPHGIKPSTFAHNLTIKNCIANNNDWDGFTLDQSVNIFVKNCSASNNGRHGFNIVTASRYTVLSNVSTSNNGYYYYTGDPGCGIIMQTNKGYHTHNLTAYNALLMNDKKGGFCTVGFPSQIKLSYMQIYNRDRCIHLTSNVTYVTISNIKCFNAQRFMVSKGVINLVAYRNTINGTVVKPIP